MDEIEMQQRPLLDDGADHDTSSASAAASATRQPPPLALHEPRALNAGKPKTARRLTPLRFCLGLLALIGLVGAGLLGWGAVSLGRLLYASFSHPHAGHRLNQTLAAAAGVPESDLVRSYFSPDGGSSHETFDLGALVYARWDEVPQPKAGRKKATDGADDETEPALDLSWLDERMGIKPAPPERTDWQLVHRSIVLKDVPVSTKPVQSIVQVTVPKDLVPSLVDPSLHPEMMASFVVLPPSVNGSDPLTKGRTTHYATVRSTAEGYPMNDGLPPPWIPYRDDSDEWSPFADFFSRGAAHSVLLHERGRLDEADPDSRTYDVMTRSWVTMARDFSVYNLTSFRAQMGVVRKKERERSRHCPGGRAPASLKCRLYKFSSTGHFENILELDPRPAGDDEPEMPNADTRFFYAPYLTTDLGSVGGLDYLPLPLKNASVESDFTFDWRITFSTSSPLKLSALQDFEVTPDSAWRQNASAYDLADSHDNNEFWNALINHPFDLNTRPVARGVLGFLAGLSGFVRFFVTLYYWTTRSLATGISLHAFLVYAVGALLIDILVSVRGVNAGESPWLMLPPLACVVAVLFFGASLALRLEWAWGGPKGWVPVGLSRRRSTHSERRSARDDARFAWRYRALVFAGFFASHYFYSSLPHLITADPPVDESQDSAFYEHRVGPDAPFLVRHLMDLVGPAEAALWLTPLVSQVALNFRRRTFAGDGPTAGVLLFAQGLFGALPTIAHGLLGRAELMAPLTLLDPVVLAVEAAFAYQAIAYPVVPQEEPEDE